MAEFCRDCFIKFLCPTPPDIDRIVMTDDDDFCEGCGEYKPVVEYIMPEEPICPRCGEAMGTVKKAGSNAVAGGLYYCNSCDYIVIE